LAIFHYALNPTGFLMLGKSESISAFADLFTVLDRKHRICARQPVESRAAFDMPKSSLERAMEPPRQKHEILARFDLPKEVDRIVLAKSAPAGLVVSENLHILQFRGQCSPYLSPSPGEATLSLLRMVRPEFAVELRTAIHRAKKQESPVRKEGLRVRRNGDEWEVGLEVVPIKGEMGERYFLVLFRDTRVKPAEAGEAERARRGGKQVPEVATLSRELQTTREYLQSIIEEQEATNEELKSANEETLSSNEELQSTNEELETAKEELQSTNEELVTVN